MPRRSDTNSTISSTGPVRGCDRVDVLPRDPGGRSACRRRAGAACLLRADRGRRAGGRDAAARARASRRTRASARRTARRPRRFRRRRGSARPRRCARPSAARSPSRADRASAPPRRAPPSSPLPQRDPLQAGPTAPSTSATTVTRRIGSISSSRSSCISSSRVTCYSLAFCCASPLQFGSLRPSCGRSFFTVTLSSLPVNANGGRESASSDFSVAQTFDRTGGQARSMESREHRASGDLTPLRFSSACRLLMPGSELPSGSRARRPPATTGCRRAARETEIGEIRRDGRAVGQHADPRCSPASRRPERDQGDPRHARHRLRHRSIPCRTASARRAPVRSATPHRSRLR